ncbi:MAG: DUF3800 domain-containing protein [Desulfarculales bacterium]|jgi:hypothetical protein|nr:DUF3800 domain-containing protein [Desulfarculales bacterium]
MYLLYADDSGLPDNNCKYCVLAGFAIRETQTLFVQKDIDKITMEHVGDCEIELHGNPMRSGKKQWRNFPKEKRDNLYSAVMQYISANYPRHFILFGAVINKSSIMSGNVSVSEELFTQLTSRFDMFLNRRYRKTGQTTKGIAIFDKSKSEEQFQNWSKIYQNTGNHWGNVLRNFAEVPLFLNSHISRPIQLADLIAYALYRKFEYNDEKYFSPIQNCFDKDDDGIVHGLYVW